jgi:hypothetical protein
MSFWEAVWLIVVGFAFIVQLMLMFMIVSDLFRDRTSSGAVKALWIVALLVLPLLTALVYLVVRGRGMAERSAREAVAVQQAQEAYIREVASGNAPTDQIAQARAMLDSGVISQPEYDRLKEKALA